MSLEWCGPSSLSSKACALCWDLHANELAERGLCACSSSGDACPQLICMLLPKPLCVLQLLIKAGAFGALAEAPPGSPVDKAHDLTRTSLLALLLFAGGRCLVPVAAAQSSPAVPAVRRRSEQCPMHSSALRCMHCLLASAWADLLCHVQTCSTNPRSAPC